MRSSVADRLGQLRFAGDPRQFSLPDIEQALNDGDRRRAPRRQARLRRLTAHFVLDSPQLPHLVDRRRRDNRLAVGV